MFGWLLVLALQQVPPAPAPPAAQAAPASSARPAWLNPWFAAAAGCAVTAALTLPASPAALAAALVWARALQEPGFLAVARTGPVVGTPRYVLLRLPVLALLAGAAGWALITVGSATGAGVTAALALPARSRE